MNKGSNGTLQASGAKKHHERRRRPKEGHKGRPPAKDQLLAQLTGVDKHLKRLARLGSADSRAKLSAATKLTLSFTHLMRGVIKLLRAKGLKGPNSELLEQAEVVNRLALTATAAFATTRNDAALEALDQARANFEMIKEKVATEIDALVTDPLRSHMAEARPAPRDAKQPRSEDKSPSVVRRHHRGSSVRRHVGPVLEMAVSSVRDR